MAVSNKEILEHGIKDLPHEHLDRLVGEDGKVLEGKEILRVFDQYPTTKNAFLDNLVNKIAKTMIYSKTWENPWAQLKKEKLDYGDSIEDLFVQMAQMKNFSEHWDNTASTDEADLIRKIKPVVLAMYKSKNIDKKFKTTVFEKDMRKAFTSSGGLGRLVQQIVSSISTSMNYNEFEMMKSTLFRAVDGMSYNGEKFVNKRIGSGTNAATLKKMATVNCEHFDQNPSDLVRLVRQTVGQMKYMKKDFNIADQKTFSKPNDLVLITTPEISSILDVNVLAHAFNVSHTDIKTRIVEVDTFDIRGAKADAYTTTDDGISANVDTTDSSALPANATPLAILIDKSFLDIRDTHQGAGTFFNPEGQYTNYFANREYLMSVCLFSNAVLFYQGQA